MIKNFSNKKNALQTSESRWSHETSDAQGNILSTVGTSHPTSRSIFYTLAKFFRVVFFILMLASTSILVNNIIHESVHWYRFRKYGIEVEDVCFVGYSKDGNILNSAGGWVQPKRTYVKLYDPILDELYDEAVPTVAGFGGALVTTFIILILIILGGEKGDESRIPIQKHHNN